MDIDTLINKRHHAEWVKREGERPAEELYAASCRRYSDTNRKALTRHQDECLKHALVEGDDAT